MIDRIYIICLCIIWSTVMFAQNTAKVSIQVVDEIGTPAQDVLVYITELDQVLLTDATGYCNTEVNVPTKINLLIKNVNSEELNTQVKITSDTTLRITLDGAVQKLSEVVIQADVFGVRQLRPIESDGLYEGKKSEVINIDKLVSNKAANNARQAYSKVPSLNIWESDAAGLQLDIGGRGLSPKRTSNFNTRQNGYDISADALGYPESYYTPPLQAIRQIEVVRGAGALQYGTQFGGLLNFKMKRGSEEKPFSIHTEQTYGSNQFINSYNAFHGQVKHINYYTYIQYKRGDGWRPNAEFEQIGGGAFVEWKLSDVVTLGFDYTYMGYLSQQAGGLVDAVFEENPTFSNRERNWFKVRWNLPAIKLRWAIDDQTIVYSKVFGLLARRTSLGLLETPDVEDPLGHRDLIDGKFTNIGNETRVVHSYKNKKELTNSLLVGMRLFRGETNFSQQFGSAGYDADFTRVDTAFLNRRRSDFNFPNLNAAIFAEHIFRLNDKLSLVPGIRYEFINTKSSGYFTNTVRINSFGDFIEQINEDNNEKDRNIVLVGLGASYKASEQYEFYANATSNYRAINFTDIQIQTNTQIVDSLIKDESGYSFDIGVRRRNHQPFFIEGGLFFILYDDRIGEVIDDGIRVRTNIGSAHIFGAELYTEVDVFGLLERRSDHKLSVFINGSVNYGVYSSINQRALVGVSTGNRLEDLPAYSIKSGVTYGYKKFKAALQGSFIGQQYSDAANTTRPYVGVYGEIPAYTVFDLSANYQLTDWLTIASSLNNVFDRSYFTRRAAAYPGPGIIPALPRTWNVSLQAKF